MVGCRCVPLPPQPRARSLSVSTAGLFAGSQDDLWRGLAAQKWPQETLRLQPFYTTFKVYVCLSKQARDQPQPGFDLAPAPVQELVQDDNKRSACPTIDLASINKLSAYKYNRPSYFLECRLIMLHWDRHAQLVRYRPPQWVWASQYKPVVRLGT